MGTASEARGFTLIEILLAIFILGIVLSTVYVSYTGTFRIIRETGYDAEIYGMARTALDRMARDLQSAAVWRRAFTFKAKPYSLRDREFVRLTFRAAAHVAFSEQDVPGGISVIEYGVEEGTEKEGYILSRSDSLYRDPEKEEPYRGGYLLCDRVEALTYVFTDEAGKEHGSWDSGGKGEMQKKRAPAEVLIRLSLVNPANREHPHLFMTRVRIPFNRLEVP
ncbi:MAG: prepilin-type N-terminal cleavage/methylation domain-containing protein [Deltaproteobacteria bacterium]|nr:prepilin-type N-terminal cleavage/methylation domain-containing protein [Deltaproteobacteria bacterium]